MPQDDPHDVLLITPDIVLVAPSGKDSANLVPDAASRSSETQAFAGPEVTASRSVPPVDTTFRAAARDDIEIPNDRPPIGESRMRGLVGLLLAAFIGVAGLASLTYGDAANRVIATLVPQLGLSSPSSPKNSGPAEQPTSSPVQTAEPKTAVSPPAPPAQTREAATSSPESTQLLQSIAHDLGTLRQETEQLKASIEQIKATQEQMSRDIAKAPSQNLRPKLSAVTPPRPAAMTPHRPVLPAPPSQAAIAPTLPQTAVPPPLRQPEPVPQAIAQPETEPVPRPPMPVH